MREHLIPFESGKPPTLNPVELPSLPPEILALVFHSLVISHQTHWLELDEVRRQCDHPMTWIPSLLHTCSLWRAVSIASPELWSFLWVGTNEALSIHMLDWSRDEPLRVYCPDILHAKDLNACGSREEPCGRQAAGLGRVLKGTRKILSMHLWGPIHAASPFLFPKLPDLEEFSLSIALPHWRMPTAQAFKDFFEHHRQLRVLAVGDLNPRSAVNVRVLPATLTRLVLWHLDQWTRNSNWAWLGHLPKLERLVLEDGSLPPRFSSQALYQLPELRKLNLGHMNTDVLHNLLHLLDIPKCTQFNLHTRYSPHILSTDRFHGIARQLRRFSDNLTMMGASELHASTSLSDYMVKITVRRELDEGEMSIFTINFRFGDISEPAKDHYLPELWKSMTSLPLKQTDWETDIFVAAPVNKSGGSEVEGTESWELVSNLDLN
ncbi:hypothetical protein DL96DRAFT_1810935 [Flagelloscypha sp. PMI_526]|nr:hypothetical protein DL96DRAFT_1810935 [Flagelloscypha sp. PMI_526]